MKLEERVGWVAKHCIGKDVLDYGCVGTNEPTSPDWLHGALRKVAKSILGIDTNKKEVEKLRMNGYNIVCANAETFISNPRKYERITACELMEHLDNVGAFLNRAKENLRDDGKLIITTPNGKHPMIWLTDSDSPDHVYVFTPNHMR